jgi:microcystin-dependent protein
MAQPYIGEIRLFAGNFAPAGWMFCEGQLLPISENDALFTLIGTTYGGDGQETFGLPDLRGRVPIHQGQGPGISQSYIIGEQGGVEEVTLTTQQIPVHTHAALVSMNPGIRNVPTDAVIGASPSVDVFTISSADTNMSAESILPVGGSQPHSNMQPYVGINYIISLFGLYPQPN